MTAFEPMTEAEAAAALIRRITRERDDAQARVRELEAMSSTATILAVRKALGATAGQSVVAQAEAVMGLVQALESQIADLRAILGATDDEMVSDAARRVVGPPVLAPVGEDPIPVHHTYAGDSTEVVIRISSRDPALLSLPFGARLGLVRLP